MSLDAFRAERLEALTLDTIVVTGLFGVKVTEQFDGLELYIRIGVSGYLRNIIHFAVLSGRKRSLVCAKLHIHNFNQDLLFIL